MKKLKIYLAIGLSILIHNAMSQDVKAELLAITDTRGSSFYAGCEVQLTFTGPGLKGAQFQKMDNALTAIDDQGNNLARDDSFGFSMGEFERIESGTDRLKWKITLKNPARTATTIKLLKGNLILFNSSLDPDSQLEYKGFGNHPNESLLKEKITEKLDVLYLDKESFETLNTNEKLKVSKSLYITNESSDEGTLEEAGHFYQFAGSSDSNQIKLYVVDTEEQILDFAFKDGTGKDMNPVSREKAMMVYTFGFYETVKNDWSLMIYLKSGKAIKMIPFELHDVKLP